LPDESKREIIARNLGISPRNDFALLERIGGECAGAVTFIPEGTTLPEADDAYRPLSIGNNDAHGKNFSFVYRGEISSVLHSHLAPLYDLISTAYYPELSPRMAMKLGGEYLSERVVPANFERLAEEGGLAKPMMKRRVLQLTEAVVAKLPAVTTDHPVTVAVAKGIQSRCQGKIKSFTA
jgi:hypothetical protein